MKNKFAKALETAWHAAAWRYRQRDSYHPGRMIETLNRMTNVERESGRQILINHDPEQRLNAAERERDRQNDAVRGGAFAIAERRQMPANLRRFPVIARICGARTVFKIRYPDLYLIPSRSRGQVIVARVKPDPTPTGSIFRSDDRVTIRRPTAKQRPVRYCRRRLPS